MAAPVTTVAEVSELVDKFILKKAERLQADKKAAALKAEEDAFKKQLIGIALESKARSLGGSVGSVNWHRKQKPTVENWEQLYAYIKQYDAFELLQRRIGEKAVEERWEDGIVIPGVVTFPVDDLTIVGKT